MLYISNRIPHREIIIKAKLTANIEAMAIEITSNYFYIGLYNFYVRLVKSIPKWLRQHNVDRGYEL